ncbi:hypothetical protein INR49_021126 [Caranx melampygus]|nr:hypothetical protein INR49_021126 [Caranx melampygus]
MKCSGVWITLKINQRRPQFRRRRCTRSLTYQGHATLPTLHFRPKGSQEIRPSQSRLPAHREQRNCGVFGLGVHWQRFLNEGGDTHSGRDLGAHYRAIMGGPEGEFPAP